MVGDVVGDLLKCLRYGLAGHHMLDIRRAGDG